MRDVSAVQLYLLCFAVFVVVFVVIILLSPSTTVTAGSLTTRHDVSLAFCWVRCQMRAKLLDINVYILFVIIVSLSLCIFFVLM